MQQDGKQQIKTTYLCQFGRNKLTKLVNDFFMIRLRTRVRLPPPPPYKENSMFNWFKKKKKLKILLNLYIAQVLKMKSKNHYGK